MASCSLLTIAFNDGRLPADDGDDVDDYVLYI